MKIKNIYYSSHFRNSFKKLPKAIQRLAAEKEIIFRMDSFDIRLETHKLQGKLRDYWAFSINHSYRIMFAFEKNGDVSFIDAGDHDIYR